MKWTIKRILTQAFLTHVGRIILGALLLIIGGLFSSNGLIGENIYNSDEGAVWNYMVIIGAVTLTIEVLIFIAYAWVINPIREYRNKKK